MPGLSPKPESPTKNRINNGWTSKKERLLKYWQEECRLYVWLHNENSSYYQKLDKLLSIPTILITAITGATMFTTINISQEKQFIIDIVFGSLLIIGTFLHSIREFLNIQELVNRNNNCGKEYLSIVNDIEEQLSQDRDDRIDGKIVLRSIKTRKNDIVRNGPSISKNTWKKLKISMENGDVINLYNTNFFHDYIHTLDEVDFLPSNQYIKHRHSSINYRNNTRSLRRRSLDYNNTNTPESNNTTTPESNPIDNSLNTSINNNPIDNDTNNETIININDNSTINNSTINNTEMNSNIVDNETNTKVVKAQKKKKNVTITIDPIITEYDDRIPSEEDSEAEELFQNNTHLCQIRNNLSRRTSRDIVENQIEENKRQLNYQLDRN